MQQLTKIVSTLLEDISTPRSLAVALMLKHGCYTDLVQLRTKPNDYLVPDDYHMDNACAEILRKCAGLPTGIDTREIAVKGFWDSEKECARTNLRLQPFVDNFFVGRPPDERIISFIERAKKKMARLLGPCPDFHVFNGKFGPGSVLETERSRTHVFDKLSGVPTLTPSALKCVPDWAETAWARCALRNGGLLNLVDGNRFTTVPKDATKDRGICVEPSVNGFYQLAVGRFLKKRLLANGLDLFHGELIHKRLAAAASKDDSLVTIDLSSASDTIADSLVKLLLPQDWYHLLDTLRCRYTFVDGKRVLLEKFSSMGNGFTFELETAIFWVLCDSLREATSVPGRVYVYGDDIIAPAACSLALSPLLRFFGFSINERKSFLSGQFRESCGGDYFNGVSVRAHYVKEIPNEPHQLIALANGLRRIGCQDLSNSDLDPRVLRAWLRVLSLIPKSAKVFGPPDLGDAVIHAPRDWWKMKTKDGIHKILTWSPVSNIEVPVARWGDDVVLAGLLYGSKPSYKGKIGAYKEPFVLRRDSVESYGRKWVCYS